MSEEIFISYRRDGGAGHARSLSRDLAEYFGPDAIFYDRKSIQEGDPFSERLQGAVENCKILIALIDPKWLNAADTDGNRRLDNPDDFVRLEIELALANDKAIPVLIEHRQAPARKALPGHLARLADIDVFELGGKDADYDAALERLVNKLATYKGVPKPRFGVGRRGAKEVGAVPPERLPYLCDRSAQAKALRRVVQLHLRTAATRPLVLVVHGQPDEAHYAYVHRVEEHELPQILQDQAVAGGVRFRHIRRPLPTSCSQATFAAALRAEISGEGLPQIDNDLKLIQYVQGQKLGGVAVVAGWRSSEIKGDFRAPLERLLEYLDAFPRGDKAPLLICIVYFKHETQHSMWRRIGAALQRKPSSRVALARAIVQLRKTKRHATLRVLPELRSVTAVDLDSWNSIAARHPEYGYLSEDRIKKILGERESAPMDRVIEGLYALRSSQNTSPRGA